jgi:hypothetical protein
MLKGLGKRLPMVQTHWWNPGEFCAGPLPLSLTWGYGWLVGWGLLFCYPKHAQLPNKGLKSILQTLTTRVWMVSRYHRMGLIVRIFFTKSHKTWARWFFRIIEATVVLQHKWEGLLTSLSLLILGLLSGMPPPSSIIQRGEHYLEPWSTPRSFLVCLFGGYLMSFNTQITVLQKRKDLMLII